MWISIRPIQGVLNPRNTSTSFPECFLRTVLLEMGSRDGELMGVAYFPLILLSLLNGSRPRDRNNVRPIIGSTMSSNNSLKNSTDKKPIHRILVKRVAQV